MHHQFQGDGAFISVESLDNRIVFVRRAAITDVYFSSDAYDTYGPEEYEGYLGVEPDDEFWKIVENLEVPDDCDGDFDIGKVEEVLRRVEMTESELKNLVASGQVAPED